MFFTSLVDEVEADGAVLVLPGLDGDVPHLAPPQERQAVVADERLGRSEAHSRFSLGFARIALIFHQHLCIPSPS